MRPRCAVYGFHRVTKRSEGCLRHFVAILPVLSPEWSYSSFVTICLGSITNLEQMRRASLYNGAYFFQYVV
jgi:hypothetical protein